MFTSDLHNFTPLPHLILKSCVCFEHIVLREGAQHYLRIAAENHFQVAFKELLSKGCVLHYMFSVTLG